MVECDPGRLDLPTCETQLQSGGAGRGSGSTSGRGAAGPGAAQSPPERLPPTQSAQLSLPSRLPAERLRNRRPILGESGFLWLPVGTGRAGIRALRLQGSSARTMPNGIKPVDPLDALSSVGAAYRSGGQPSNCKYWILDLGTRAAGPSPGPLAAQAAPGRSLRASPCHPVCLRTEMCCLPHGGGLRGRVLRGPLGMRGETGLCPLQSRRLPRRKAPLISRGHFFLVNGMHAV